jgi:hypothetical protein
MLPEKIIYSEYVNIIASGWLSSIVGKRRKLILTSEQII